MKQQCELIIGRDILGELGTITSFNVLTITWDTDIIPLKEEIHALHHLFISK
jgi:hypothetical protein